MLVVRRLAAAGVLLATMASLLVAPLTASAEDALESITLSPVKKTYELKPGQTIEDSITILNDGRTAYDFVVYAAPYSVTDSSYVPDFTTDKTSPNTDAYTWVQFPQTNWHAEPRQTLTIPFTIHVKQDASPGGHYGAIFAETQPLKEDGGNIARKKRVGSIIYATVSGDVNMAGRVTSLDIPWFQSSAPLITHAAVENTGNTDFSAAVSYQVSDVLGSVKYTSQKDYAVLPSTTRDVSQQWDSAPWFGLYKVHISTEVLGQKTEKNSYVLIMPKWLILLLVIVLAIGVVYVFWHRKKTA